MAVAADSNLELGVRLAKPFSDRELLAREIKVETEGAANAVVIRAKLIIVIDNTVMDAILNTFQNRFNFPSTPEFRSRVSGKEVQEVPLIGFLIVHYVVG